MEKLKDSISTTADNITEPLSWIDTHCHFDMMEGTAEENINRSREHAVEHFITIGTEPATHEKVLDLITNHKNIWGSLGCHPHHADQWSSAERNRIETLCQENEKIVAIGEAGFDFYYNRSSKELQKKAFGEQMDLALGLDRPLVIHTRHAERETMELTRSFFRLGLRAVFHSFTSDISLARFALDQDAFIAFNGICTFKNAEELRKIVRYVPIEKMLLETDAPFLAPVPYRGKKNIPGYLSATAAFIADLLGWPLDLFSKQMMKNSLTLFDRIKLCQTA